MILSRPGLKRIVLRAAKLCGLFALSRHLTRRGLRILCYHGIWLGPGHFADYLFMSADKFRRRMTWLARSAYPVLSLEEATRALAAGTLPPNATVITIDDGWYGSYRHMLPVLREHGLPATLYVSTYYVQRQLPVFDVALQYLLAKAPRRTIDLRRTTVGADVALDLDNPSQKARAMELILAQAVTMNGPQAFDLLRTLAAHMDLDMSAWFDHRVFHLMTAEEVRESAAQGLDIQLHTHRHRLTVDRVQDLTKELADNRTQLSTMTNSTLDHFCYPSGVWSEECWPILQSAGIKSATTTVQGLNFSGENPLKLKRLLDGESVDDLEFEAELSGLFELKRMVVKRLRG